MINPELQAYLSSEVSRSVGSSTQISKCVSIGGGCINQAGVLEAGSQRYFIKLNRKSLARMFEIEAAGLDELGQANALRVPSPICFGVFEDQSYLVLEYLDLCRGVNETDRIMGQGLAALHRVTAERYGWSVDNYIGSTCQPNHQSDSWLEFWREQRLGFQLQLAAQNGHGGRLLDRGERLLSDLDQLLGQHQPPASLLHGDLWGGNAAVTRDGEPVIFDPAVYYGGREADLAMTELFGGFSRDFYSAYESDYPMDHDYGLRKVLYNLYHILNHLNLFGSGYLSQAEGMIDQLLAEIT